MLKLHNTGMGKPPSRLALVFLKNGNLINMFIKASGTNFEVFRPMLLLVLVLKLPQKAALK